MPGKLVIDKASRVLCTSHTIIAEEIKIGETRPD
jgi:hypothetical protein